VAIAGVVVAGLPAEWTALVASVLAVACSNAGW
jgi:hypothetical protein